jgi:hypothetical protein
VEPSASGAHKRGKIVEADHPLKGNSHVFFVEAMVVSVPSPWGQEQIGSPTVVNDVSVTPVHSGITGMPIPWLLNRFTHPDRSG